MKREWFLMFAILLLGFRLQAQLDSVQMRINEIIQLESAEGTRMIRVLQKSQDQPHFTVYRVGDEMVSFTLGYVGAGADHYNHYYLQEGELIAVDYSTFTYHPETHRSLQKDSRHRFYFQNVPEDLMWQVIDSGTEPEDSLELAHIYQEIQTHFPDYRDQILNSIYWNETDERILSIVTFAQIVEQGIDGGYFGWAEVPDSKDPSIGSFGIPRQAEKMVVESGSEKDKITHHYYLKEDALLLYIRTPYIEEPLELLSYQPGQEYFYFDQDQLIRQIGPDGEEVDLSSTDSEKFSRTILKDTKSYQQQLKER